MDTLNEEHPFTPGEKQVMDALVDAHNKFCKLKEKGLYHPQALEWQAHMHALQDILIVDTVIRKYPDYFNQVK